MTTRRCYRLDMRSVVALVVGALGCGASVAPEASPTDASSAEVVVEPPCPSSPPAPGAACTHRADEPWVRCSYGDDPVPRCRAQFSCALSNEWQGSRPCARPEPGWCPPTPPTDGAACTYREPWACAYDGGVLCDCEVSVATRWRCRPPPPSPCPATPPNAGTPCASPGLYCEYGRPSRVGSPTSGPRVCRDGYWIATEPFISK